MRKKLLLSFTVFLTILTWNTIGLHLHKIYFFLCYLHYMVDSFYLFSYVFLKDTTNMLTLEGNLVQPAH